MIDKQFSDSLQEEWDETQIKELIFRAELATLEIPSGSKQIFLPGGS
jgi:hypothetical protein